MNKKLVVVSILVVLLAALAVVGIALAQKPNPTTPYAGPFGQGMMGRGGYGPMHEYMEDALAEALDLTHEEFEERLANGETPWTIAEEKGLSAEEFTTLMTDARNKALEAMVADGVITREQADWMSERMGTMLQNGYGPGFENGYGSCPMGGGFGGGRRSPGGRWSQTP